MSFTYVALTENRRGRKSGKGSLFGVNPLLQIWLAKMTTDTGDPIVVSCMH